MTSEEQPRQRISIDDLCRIKADYVDDTLKRYQQHATWPRVVFRLVGMTVIVLSLGIPFLAAADGSWQTVGVPIASFLIAALTALNAFFNWQKTWEKRMSMQLTLEGLVANWETEIAAARLKEQGEGFDRALKATQELIARTQAMTVAETNAFFASIKFPEVSSGQRPGGKP
jgi:hypothetical protein